MKPEDIVYRVERLHNCAARIKLTTTVHEKWKGETVWMGQVHILDIAGNPNADICYAWDFVTDERKRRFVAALRGGASCSASRLAKEGCTGSDPCGVQEQGQRRRLANIRSARFN